MKSIEHILSSIESKDYTVSVIGLGYVGLPLLLSFHKKGFAVIGIDVSSEKIEMLKRGQSYIKHIDQNEIKELSLSKRVRFSLDISSIVDADAILLCLPTPLNGQKEPDMSYVDNAIKSLIPHVRPGHLIVLESTTYPGATEEHVKVPLEKNTPLRSEEDFFLAYSPEREDPGNSKFSNTNTPKVVSGDGPFALQVATALYKALTKVVPVSNLKTGEAVKLMENIFRSINIALVNELKMIFSVMGINTFEVVNAASTKPFGFMPFYPGPGVGGHCIPIDPFYLSWKAKQFGSRSRFIELAGEINDFMPHYTVENVNKALESHNMNIQGAKILCLGITYKPDIDDMRESPTLHIMRLLRKSSAEVDYYDPYVPEISRLDEYREFDGKSSIKWDQETISSYNLAIIVTHHLSLNYVELEEWCPIIVDTRNIMPPSVSHPRKLWMS